MAAGIFTENSARSLRVARSVRAGIVWVNTYRVVSPIAEFGGFKGSGYGRESGFQAMAITRVQKLFGLILLMNP